MHIGESTHRKTLNPTISCTSGGRDRVEAEDDLLFDRLKKIKELLSKRSSSMVDIDTNPKLKIERPNASFP